MRSFMVLCLAVAFTPGAAAAQVIGDTVSYHELTEARMTFRAPQGELSIDSRHDATIDFWQVRADSAQAWYQDLSITLRSPMRNAAPDLSSLRGQNYVLRVAGNGRVQTLATPVFPSSLEEITDLRHQFFDFFPARPAVALRTGLTWTDTLTMAEDSAGLKGVTTKVITYRVVRDTVFEGAAAFVVEGQGLVTMNTSGPLRGQPGMSMVMSFSGPEENHFVVGTDARLLQRRRTADFSGEVTYEGGPAPVRMPVRQTYTSSIDVLER